MIKAEGLNKKYGQRVALSDFSLDVAKGEIVALVGPNGAGKTTALKLLAGLLTPDSGDAWVAGYHVTKQAQEVKQRFAFLPDTPFLYDTLTVMETLAFVGGMYRMDRARLQRRIDELMSTLDLHDRLGTRIGDLSYGMRSRVAVAMSFLHEPQALIMDEPFFGLDPRTLHLVKQFVAKQASGGTSLLLSTHQLPIVETLAHRIAIIDQGKLLAVETWESLKKRYASTALEDIYLRLIHE